MGLQNCPDLSAPEQESTIEEAGSALPWSGLALGLTDLPAVTGLSRSRLVAVIGLPKAGKTTALAATLLACRQGLGDYGERFAGSYTLAGWYQIARRLQWIPHGTAFPPHTTSADARSPALLHLSLKPADASPPVDVLYTDVPGEWFRSWAYEERSHKGARWIAANADSFIIFADSDALAGAERGAARADYEALARRLKSAAGTRPVVPFRTKADIEISDGIRGHIDTLNRSLFDAPTRAISVSAEAVSAETAEPITAAVDAGTAAAFDKTPGASTAGTSDGSDHFMVYRSRVLQEESSP